MSVWDRFRDFWGEHGKDDSREPLWMEHLTRDQVTDSDLRLRSGIDVKPGVHYLQLTARRMNLRTDELFGAGRFPVVHSQVLLDTTGGSKITYPAVAGHDALGELDLAAGGNATGASYPLTPVVPYHTGQLEFVAGVVSMKGDNNLIGPLTRVVSRVTTAFPAAVGVGTAVQTAIGFADTALSCVEDLFGLPDSKIVLGMHDLFGDGIGTPLRTGLFAVVDPRSGDHGASDQIVERGRLRFDSEELKYETQPGQLLALRGYDWIVIELGALDHRPYTAFPDLVAAYNNAVEELGNDATRAVAEFNAALMLAGLSGQIVRRDRAAVMSEMRDDFTEMAGAVGVTLGSPQAPADSGKTRRGLGLEHDPTSFFVSVA
jgi:hypothetical protein